MRVNIDDQALTEPRTRRMARVLTTQLARQVTHHEVLGRLVAVWMLCYQRRSALVAGIDIDIAADLDGFATAMLECDLADPTEGGDALYVRGVSERIEFLEKQADKGRASGEARRKKHGVTSGSASTGSTRAHGRLNSARTDAQQVFGLGSTTPRTYSPDLDLDQAPDQAQDHPPNGNPDGSVSEVDGSDSEPVESASSDPRQGDTGQAKHAAPRASASPEPVRTPIEPPTEAMTCAHLLLEYVKRNNPDSKLARAPEAQLEATAIRWGHDVRKLHSLDRIEYPAIQAMIHWCQRNSFWRGVILSGENLRDKWDKMAAQRRNRGPSPTSSPRNPAGTPPDAFGVLDEHAEDMKRSGNT